jgi:hypothetical protein
MIINSWIHRIPTTSAGKCREIHKGISVKAQNVYVLIGTFFTKELFIIELPESGLLN